MLSTMTTASSLPAIGFFFNNSSSSIKFYPPCQVRFPISQQRPFTDSVHALSSSLGKLSLSKVVCRSTYNQGRSQKFKFGWAKVIVADNEPEERLVNRFRREVLRAGIIQESKRRRFFENNQEKRKRKMRDAAKRNRKRRRVVVARDVQMNAEDEEKKRKEKQGWYDETEDNWTLPSNIP